MKKYVYSFNEGSKNMQALLGGKGANLAEMSNIGLPVPFGFTITTEACSRYYEDNQTIAEEIRACIREKIRDMEEVTGKKFGSAENPLLVSVRSDAINPILGETGSILNLGLNDRSAEGLAVQSKNPQFAADSYCRLLQMYGTTVMGVPNIYFEEILSRQRSREGVTSDERLSAESLRAAGEAYQALILDETGKAFPQDSEEQLFSAIQSFFQSQKGKDGTAVHVQAMVFGNLGMTSGTGIAFTRNPATGENRMTGEFLVHAQGNELTEGIYPPLPIESMETIFPDAYKNFVRIAELLEKHYKDMQTIAFTIENNKLYILQTENGKRTAQAAVKTAVDMTGEGLIDKKTAIGRIHPKQIEQLLHSSFEPSQLENAEPVAKGLPASPGAGCGILCFNAEDAAAAAAKGRRVLLVREETSPEDLSGMLAADGILAAKGGMTSHAAVVARGMGKCCVAGCPKIRVNEAEQTVSIADGKVYRAGDYLSLDGNTGLIYEGMLQTVPAKISNHLEQIMEWADEFRELKIRANADNPKDAQQALEFGAEGIGLCRTEHMFFGEDRLPAIRRMIFADTPEEEAAALAVVRPLQENEFCEIFRVMGDRPVTIRLLDPPLHEFLPQNDAEIDETAAQLGIERKKLEAKIAALHEVNPMLGHRGCRLMITKPQIAVMQTEAMIRAALTVKAETGNEIVPEIMIPLVDSNPEMKVIKQIITAAADACIRDSETELSYQVGTMIETPRAALTAGELAASADFFSFGTNDLTQMTYGLSRDDTGQLIEKYIHQGILSIDPFKTLDTEGVGKLIAFAAKQGKQTKTKLKLGICGEHGGDPKSIAFCHKIGLHYVSCSPFRVPIARLAAAQAAVMESQLEGE